jgi:hypothetical protein
MEGLTVDEGRGGARGLPWRAVAAAALVVLAVVGAWASPTAPAGGASPRARAHAQVSRLTAATSSTTTATRGADAGRTGWYPDQTTLSPQLVGGGTFGQLFSTPVNGAVYGQPLVDDSQLLVNTENNLAYGLDPVSGAILWSRQFGSPPLASSVGCADLAPTMGITSTPVVDQSTNTEYLVDDEYLSGSSGLQAYYMHALDLTRSGAEQPGFPVQIQGTASNSPSVTFNPTYQLQRPGLLLMNGVVYVGFGAHCDIAPYQGWIAGVAEAGHMTTLWTTAPTPGLSGAGVWMAGGGLVSDRSGQILFATGNGSSNSTPTAGATPPANLGESVVRLAVQGDGSLKATDFFEPYDASTLDGNDLDFGSGSPVSLPDTYFGTSGTPHLAVEVGKEGYVYLLNRDSLGGFASGSNGTDAVVGKYGPNGGVWSSPAVWPGDGGWIYVPTASGAVSAGGSAGLLDAYQYGVDGTGKPTLNLVGTSPDAFGFGTSAPVVTSNGTTSGTSVLWTVWSPDGTGVGAQLRAYNPIPVSGKMQLVWSAPVGTASKFNPPGVAAGRLYVGNRNGTVQGFGAPVSSPVTAPAATFPATVVGQSTTQTVTLTASSAATVTGLTAAGHFTLGSPSRPLPATLAVGGTMTVPITFSPTTAGASGGSLTISTGGTGTTVVSLTGTGQVNGPSLTSSTLGVSFGGIPPGQQSSQTVSFANNGSQPLTINGVTPPTAPFGVSGAPAVGAVLQPGAQVVVNLGFAPTVNGNYSDALTVASNGGTVQVTVTGSADAPALLAVSSLSVGFGPSPVGRPVTKTFTLSNTGGSNLTITKSKPPVLGPFAATSALPEGSTIAPGGSVVESVTFGPTAVGTTSDGWVITTNDGHGVRTVQFSGTGTLGDPGATGWTRNGSATLVNGAVQLTPPSKLVVGSTFAPVAVASAGLTVSYTSTISTPRFGGDGTALVLANGTVAPTALGGGATGFGFDGIPGVAVVLSTARVTGVATRNFVGISDGPQAKSPLQLHWLATSTAVTNLHAAVAVRVTLAAGVLTVSVNGSQVLSTAVHLGPNVRIGFTGSTGGTGDTQTVSGVTVAAGGAVAMVGGPPAGGWTLNGSSALSGGTLQLTGSSPGNQAGTAFWPTPLSSSNLRATFTTSIGGGGASGADGMALVLADGATAPTALGAQGGGLGFSGIHGVAVALDTYGNPVNPSGNFVGVTDGPVTAAVPDQLHWLATDTGVADLRATHTFVVTLIDGTLSVTMDGTKLLTTSVTVGPNVLLGFSGGTGTVTDTHGVSNVFVTAAPRTGVAIGDPMAGGWSLNGSTVQSGGTTQLTQTVPGFQAGTAFWPTPVSSEGLTASFSATIGGNVLQGADGMSLVLADPSTAPTAVGYYGGGLGFSGITGICVAIDTYQNASNPSSNFSGVADGPVAPGTPDQLHWLTTANVVPTLRSTHTFTVTLVDGTLTVSMDGTQVLTTTVTVGPHVLVGFSAGTGSITDTHAVGTVAVNAA